MFQLLTLLTLLPLTFSSPIPQTVPPPTTTYNITNFISHCSPGTCTYNFNITSTASTSSSLNLGLPFTDHCRGYSAQGDFQGCDSFNFTGIEANMKSTDEGLVVYLQRVILWEQGMREVGGNVVVNGGGDVWTMEPEDYVVTIGLL